MPVHPDGSISITTLGDMIDGGYSLSAHCHAHGCMRQLDLDVYDLAARFGRDTISVNRKHPIKCAKCGSRNIGYVLGAETRSAELVRKEGPKNMRANRDDAERERALALISPEARRRFGLRAK